MATQRDTASDLFEGPGQLRALYREMDWAATPLGPVESWPQVLWLSTQTVLSSGLPHVLLWGSGFTQVYNDGYARLLGPRHPKALGHGVLETLPELESTLRPVFDRVLAGETVTMEDALYPVQRERGVEDVYLTISYSPVRDTHGEVVGILAGMVETTKDVAFRSLQRDRERLFRELELERGRLATVFEQAPAFIATLRGPDHVFEMANPSYRQLVGHREVVGKTVREALPEIVEQGFVELLDSVYASGETFEGREVPISLQRVPGGVPEERFLNFVYQPIADPSGAVSGVLAHGVDVTELVLARRQAERQAVELEARAEEANRSRAAAEESRAIADAFYEAAPIPTALIGRDLRYQRVNRAMATFYGLSPEEILGRSLREVVPDYAERIEPYYRQVLETGQPIRNLEVVVPERSGARTNRNFLLNYFPAQVRHDEVIAIGVVALDVTERHQMEVAQREQTALVEAVQRVGRSVASELDLESIVQEVTDAATELTSAQFGAFFYNVMDESGESYTLYTISGVPREKFSRFPMPRNTPVFGPTFHGDGIVRSDDITKDPRYGQMSPYHGMPEGHLPVTSYLAAPVVSRTGEVLGGLFFGHEEAGRFEERHERLAEGIAGWAAVAMDNARLYQAERTARAEAERANRVKSEFLATMSHELRTPLNAMIGYTDLILAGVPTPVPDEAAQKVERIGISARHLLELIEEILTFSRLEAGEERTNIEPLDLEGLLQEVQALSEPLAMEKGIGLELHLAETNPALRSDARKLRQILVNLVGNAIKFTEHGQVSLHAAEVGQEILLSVSDTGPGIAPEHMEKIFEPFWQVEGGTTRQTGGTGLGLGVTRRLARLLGGDVTAESTPGEGSTFTVRLPLEAPPAPDH